MVVSTSLSSAVTPIFGQKREVVPKLYARRSASAAPTHEHKLRSAMKLVCYLAATPYPSRFPRVMLFANGGGIFTAVGCCA